MLASASKWLIVIRLFLTLIIQLAVVSGYFFFRSKLLDGFELYELYSPYHIVSLSDNV